MLSVLRDYALKFECIAEKAVFPSCVPPESQEASAGSVPSKLPERKRICPPIEHVESAALSGLVDALARDLRMFVSRIDVFDTVFAEVRSPHITHRAHAVDEWWTLINSWRERKTSSSCI